jgi:hypothetical protein
MGSPGLLIMKSLPRTKVADSSERKSLFLTEDDSCVNYKKKYTLLYLEHFTLQFCLLGEREGGVDVCNHVDR